MRKTASQKTASQKAASRTTASQTTPAGHGRRTDGRRHLRLLEPPGPQVHQVWHPSRGGRPPLVALAPVASPRQRARIAWTRAGESVIEVAAWR